MTGFKGTDNHAAALMSVLRRTAEVNNNIVYLLHREGLDVIQRPDSDEDVEDLVWVSAEGIETKSPTRYVFRGDTSVDGLYKSDLLKSPEFVASAEAGDVIESLCEMNEPLAMANMIGWYVSCFHRQLYHKLLREFPLLHIYGTAGSGKTQSYLAMSPLFYYKNKPYELNVAGCTAYALKATTQTSASLPAFLDEYKPQAMAQTWVCVATRR